MKIKQYDQIMLKDGNKGYVVEIFDNGKAFLVDVDKHGETYTEFFKISEINRVI